MRRLRGVGALALCVLLLILSLALSQYDAGAFPLTKGMNASLRNAARTFMGSALIADASAYAAPRASARLLFCLYPALLLCALCLALFTGAPESSHRLTVYTSGSFVSHPRQAPPIA